MQYRNNAEVPFSAYITNLGKYTEGRTEGEWVDFPTTKEKLQETMKRIGIGDKRADGTVYEEIFITDYTITYRSWYSLILANMRISTSLTIWQRR